MHASKKVCNVFQLVSKAFTDVGNEFATNSIGGWKFTYLQKVNHTIMGRKDLENKKEMARVLYMAGENQLTISEKVNVSRVTINKWVAAGGWKERRAAKAVTRPELINKMLLNIDALLDKAAASDKPEDLAGMSDKLSKIASAIEKLDKKANVVDAIEVFIAFSKWVEFRIGSDKEITPDLVKLINKLQDQYMNEQFNLNSPRK